MKSLNEIDLDEWEILPDDGFLEINHDASGEKTFSRNHSKNSSVFQMNYFICPEKPMPAPIDLPVQVEVSKLEPEHEPEPEPVFFVDMKVDSPKSSSEKGFTPQLDFQFEEKALEVEESNDEVDHCSEKSDPRCEDEAGLNIWKWSLTAICTFAATVCIVSLTGQHKIHKGHQFQFYTSDKRMKQVVHHASKINEAIWAVRGVPITRAQITFGGHYDASSL